MADTVIHPETTIGDVRLTVGDLTRSLAFYTEALGLRVLERGEGHATLSANGTEPARIFLTEQPGALPKPRSASGLYHFALLYPSRRALARALRQLAIMRVPIQGASDHLVSEAIYLADPDGHGIEIYADRPRERWPRRNGQLQMATEPLDLDSLMAELRGDDEPWTGADPATVVGHVHLHTASLSTAVAFYRDLLGLEEIARYGPSAIFLAAGGYHHHLGLNTWAGVGVPPPPSSSVRLQSFSFVLPTVEELSLVARRLLHEEPTRVTGLYDVGNGLELHLVGPDEIGVILLVRTGTVRETPRRLDLAEWLAKESVDG